MVALTRFHFSVHLDLKVFLADELDCYRLPDAQVVLLDQHVQMLTEEVLGVLP